MPNIDQFQARSGRLIKEDGTVVNEANGINADGSQNVSLVSSNVAQPVDIQARLSQTIQTHNAVSVAASGWSPSAWFDCDGFDNLIVTLLNSAVANSVVNVLWSHDGVNTHGEEVALSSSNGQYRKSLTLPIGARYVKVSINNADASARTLSAWVFLKA